MKTMEAPNGEVNPIHPIQSATVIKENVDPHHPTQHNDIGSRRKRRRIVDDDDNDDDDGDDDNACDVDESDPAVPIPEPVPGARTSHSHTDEHINHSSSHQTLATHATPLMNQSLTVLAPSAPPQPPPSAHNSMTSAPIPMTTPPTIHPSLTQAPLDLTNEAYMQLQATSNPQLFFPATISPPSSSVGSAQSAGVSSLSAPSTTPSVSVSDSGSGSVSMSPTSAMSEDEAADEARRERARLRQRVFRQRQKEKKEEQKKRHREAARLSRQRSRQREKDRQATNGDEVQGQVQAVTHDIDAASAVPLSPLSQLSADDQDEDMDEDEDIDDENELDEGEDHSDVEVLDVSKEPPPSSIVLIPTRPSIASTSSTSTPSTTLSTSSSLSSSSISQSTTSASSSSSKSIEQQLLDMDDTNGKDDDVEIISSSSTSVSASNSSSSQPVRKRPRRISPLASANAPVGSLSSAVYDSDCPSPTAPPLSPVSEAGSPVAPPMSPVEPTRRLATLSSAAYIATPTTTTPDILTAEQRLALLRERTKQARSNGGSDSSNTAANQTNIPSASSTSSSSSSIRRRKVASSAVIAASNFASASLCHSYGGFRSSSSTSSSIDPSLLWFHELLSVPLPSNPLDKIDVERTLLQQVLVWECHTHSTLDRRPVRGKEAAKEIGNSASSSSSSSSNPLAAFAKFLDLDTPLPVHFTSPGAYLGYFGPVVLENFRAQLIQTVEEHMPLTRAPSPSPSPSPPPASSPPSFDRHRTAWLVSNVQGCPSVSGGGDDWLEVRLKLAQAHRAVGQMAGADIVALGIDMAPIPQIAPTNTTASKGANNHNNNPNSNHNANPPLVIPPPSNHTVYVFAFLDRLDSEGSNCFCRLRLFLPGVSSALSDYVATPSTLAPSAATVSSISNSSKKKKMPQQQHQQMDSKTRFQLFYNRLQAALQANSNPIEEGSKSLNQHANFTSHLIGIPAGSSSSSSADKSISSASRSIYPVYLTRIDTTITTLREYTALVKVACMAPPPLRIQQELLRPSPAQPDEEDDEEEEGTEGDANAKSKPIPDSNRPPALESIEQVVKSKQPPNATATTIPRPVPLDSPAWLGLPNGFRDYLQVVLNRRQLKAVRVALKRYEKPGFTLLQGPRQLRRGARQSWCFLVSWFD